jgi:hypothetical protein
MCGLHPFLFLLLRIFDLKCFFKFKLLFHIFDFLVPLFYIEVALSNCQYIMQLKIEIECEKHKVTYYIYA